MSTKEQYEIRISMVNSEGRQTSWLHTVSGDKMDIDSIYKGARAVANIFETDGGFEVLDVHVSLVNVYDIVY